MGTPEKSSRATAVFSFEGQGGEVQAHILRLTRHAAVFEVPNPLAGLRASEVLKSFAVIAGGRTIYSGRAVIRSLINSGPNLVCEVTLSEEHWQALDITAIRKRPGGWDDEYRAFLDEWQRLYRIRPEYKLIISDMQTYFNDLRLWLAQVDLGIASAPELERATLERAVAEQLAGIIIPSINDLFAQFEAISIQLEPGAVAAHQNYMRRQLHSLVLCVPFAHRTFSKPLGYAGDYEMVNMILRNDPEGDSLFAKVFHAWFVRQPPAEAHRNRIDYLVEKITNETMRANRAGRDAKVFNIACGPASEVERFLKSSPLRRRTQFTLLDFNEETLQYTRAVMEKAAPGRAGLPPIQYIKKSVHHLLKEGGGRRGDTSAQGVYDFVYCAGLFDYLSNQVCQRLMDIMYDWVAPGGLLVATNVEPTNPMRHGMDHLLDWPLIYRTAADLKAVKPSRAAADDVQVYADATGVNVFIEVRKPENG